MTRHVFLLVGIPLAVGAAVAIPVGWVRGPSQWGFAAAAFGLCIPPGVVVLVSAGYLARVSPYGRLLAVFVGTVVRLVAAFGGGVVVFLVAGPGEKADRVAFWLWVLFAYLTTLAVETALLAGPARRPAAGADVAGGAGHGG